jgi:hypothetical protein
MKTLFLATAAALSLSMRVAYAGDGDVPQANTLFTELPGVIAQAPVYNPTVMTAQNGQEVQNGLAVQTYATQSNRGTWLYQGGGSIQGANS